MRTPAECHAKARDLVQLAIPFGPHSAECLEMAATWRRLATEIEAPVAADNDVDALDPNQVDGDA